MRISFFSRHGVGFFILFCVYSPVQSQNDSTENTKPNIVLIWVDDSGLMD